MKQKNSKTKKSSSLSEVSIDIILNIIKVSVLSLSQLTLQGSSTSTGEYSPQASSCTSSAADHHPETQEYFSHPSTTRMGVAGRLQQESEKEGEEEPTEQLSSYFTHQPADQEVYIWKPRRVVEEDVNDRAGDYISKVRKGFNKGE